MKASIPRRIHTLVDKWFQVNSSETAKRRFLKVLPLIPLAIAVGIVPLVVFLKVIPIPAGYQQFWMTSLVFDFFSYYKAQLIVICAGLLLAAIVVLVWLGALPRKSNILYIPLAVYAVGLVASTIKSAHPLIALEGFFDRDEGLWVLLAYIVLFLAAYLFAFRNGHVWLVLAAWMAALCVIGTVGIFQYLGIDFFKSMAGRLLILPARYHFIASELDFAFPPGTIYSTLYNPNNVASMFALAFPFAAVGFVLSRLLSRQIIFGFLAALFCLTLLGTNGRAAWLAVLLAMFLLMFLSIRGGVKGWWKRLIILGLVALAGYGIFNYVSSGNLGKRAAQPISDVRKIVENGLNPVEAGESLTQPGAQEGLAEQLIRKYGGDSLRTRGYIWIRSLQMAQNTLLLGHGPDTFALYFSNSDPYKIYYSQPEIVIDKPHNLYLQLWLNLGGLSALAFVAMLVLHAVRTLGILRVMKPDRHGYLLALGLFAGWFSYVVAAFFYDSTVSVAPAFWIVFGLSLAVNEMLAKDQVLAKI